MNIEGVTGGRWWQIFRLGSLARPRARDGDCSKHLSHPVTYHPIDVDVTLLPLGRHSRPGVTIFRGQPYEPRPVSTCGADERRTALRSTYPLWCTLPLSSHAERE